MINYCLKRLKKFEVLNSLRISDGIHQTYYAWMEQVSSVFIQKYKKILLHYDFIIGKNAN